MNKLSHPYLLLAIRMETGAEKRDMLREQGAVDWEALRIDAVQQGVGGILYDALRPHHRTLDIPPEVWAQLERRYLVTAVRNTRLYDDLAALLQVFHHERIRVITLKGAFLAENVYGNVALRGMCDVDLLVKEADLRRVERVLLDRGAIPDDRNRAISRHHKDMAFLLPGSKLHIEVHWALTYGYPPRIRPEDLWDRASPTLVGTAPAWALSAEDMLLHLCMHTADHVNDMHLRMVYDLALVVKHYEQSLDWKALERRAHEWGIAHAVYAFLRLTREWLGAPVNTAFLSALQPGADADLHLDQLRQRILAGPVMAHAAPVSNITAQFWNSRGLRARVAFVRDRLHLSREIMAQQNPGASLRWHLYPRYYAARMRSILRHHAPSLMQLLRGNRKARVTAAEMATAQALKRWLLSD